MAAIGRAIKAYSVDQMGDGIRHRKKKDKPETITKMEWENEDCDEAANERVEADLQPPLFEPLPGFRAMLKLDDEWVTTHFRQCVRFANNAPMMVEYVMGRLNISLEVFNTINWRAIGRVRAEHKIGRLVRTSKMMYRWLPVGHNWEKCSLDTHKCPCCGADDETFEHLLKCKHEDLVEVRHSFYLKLISLSKSDEIPSNFLSALSGVLRHITDGSSLPEVFKTEAITRAVDQQKEIGLYNLAVGFMANGWTTALAELKTDQPDSKVEIILRTIWDDLCEPIWKARNNIKHGPQSETPVEEMQSLADKLRWYRMHQNSVLDYRHRFLADASDVIIDRWSRDARRAQLALLADARRYHEVEIAQRLSNQTTISDWLDQYKRLRSGRLIGEGLRTIRDGGIRQGSDESPHDEEEEFEWESPK